MTAPRITWTLDANGRLTLFRDRTAMMSIGVHDWIIEHVARIKVTRRIAWDFFRESGRDIRHPERVVELGTGQFHLVNAQGQPLARVEASHAEDGLLTLRITANGEVNRVGFHWWAPASEGLYGFGEYGNGPRNPAHRWSTWTEEGPVGLGFLSRWLRPTRHVPIPKGYASTYAPMPTWLSSLGYAAWLDNAERIDWTVRGARRSVRVWSSQLVLRIVPGRDLKDALSRRAAHIGFPPMVPAWVLLPWIDAVRGQETVRATADRLRREHIPASAIWVEDWTGSWEDDRRFWMRPLSHEVNQALYPDVPAMARDLHSKGFKLLGYFCPEVAVDTPLYQEALAGEHLVRDASGAPVAIDILGNRHGEVDLTRPNTRQWIRDRWFAPALKLGFDGWMADFGEYLPVHAALSDGTSGWDSHNRYPVLWQSLNREFFEDARPDGDYTFFVRSAGLQTPHIAPVMWGGDSDTDWDRADGLATVVPQALSAAVSGQALWATDIAGYMTFGLTRPSSKELYLRWTELAALFPVMRTHHGTARPRNWNWDRDRETIELFARYARLHAALLPLFYSLASIAHRTGIAPIRPLFLEFDTPGLERVNDQFLLGADVMVAPVIRRKQQTRQVVLPPGQWHDWWSSRTWQGPATVDVSAPLGHIPILVRRGSLIPLMEGRSGRDHAPNGFVETLMPPQEAEAFWSKLTVWMTGPLTEPITIHLPQGILAVTPSLSAPPANTRHAGPALHADHAPIVGVRGEAFDLRPRDPRRYAGGDWYWDGRGTLVVTCRRFAEDPSHS